MSLGELIVKRRKLMDLTQEELADKVAVSKSAIAKWETNRGIPDRDNLKKLADVIGVSISEMHQLIGGVKAEKADIEVNITAEVIASLEAHGYKVIRPGEY